MLCRCFLPCEPGVDKFGKMVYDNVCGIKRVAVYSRGKAA